MRRVRRSNFPTAIQALPPAPLVLSSRRRGEKVLALLDDGRFGATVLAVAGAARYVKVGEGPYAGASLWLHKSDLALPRRGRRPKPVPLKHGRRRLSVAGVSGANTKQASP